MRIQGRRMLLPAKNRAQAAKDSSRHREPDARIEQRPGGGFDPKVGVEPLAGIGDDCKR